MKSFDSNFEELRQSIKKNQNLNTNNETSSQQIQVPQIKTSNVTNQSNNITKYAKYADLGDGFSANELLDSPDDDTIFEIQIISNNSALLRIISNNNAQRYALTNPSYFFSKTCEYDSVPSANSKIVTSSDGDLKLQSGKWQITNPAKISFE
jgi:hypothetical protein